MHKSISTCLLLIGLISAPISGFAFVSNFSNLYVDASQNGGSGKNRAAAQAQSQHGGKVLSVREANKNGQLVYKVKLLLDSGRIKIVTIKG